MGDGRSSALVTEREKSDIGRKIEARVDYGAGGISATQ